MMPPLVVSRDNFLTSRELCLFLCTQVNPAISLRFCTFYHKVRDGNLNRGPYYLPKPRFRAPWNFASINKDIRLIP
jgi:hypothetical protein